MTYNSISKGIIHLFAFIDYLVYGLASVVMDGLYNIAGTKIFANSSVTEIFDRLYVILGIFMLFKLAFSLLNGIINPDKFNDKQNGFSNIIKRVIITISLLLMVPTIFNAAYHVQGNIIKALPQIILGPNQSYGDSSAGREISETILSAFIHENEKCSPNEELKSVTLDNFIELATEKCPNNDSNGKKIFKNTYSIIISSAVGIVLIIMLVLVSVDVGIRLIKMSLLQLVAPIPIMTYIDPKSEKDGAFGNWTKECIQTYISLFIQLGTVYLMIYLISSITKDFTTNPTGIITFPDGISPLAKIWVFIFIVIGGFFFMKEGPKFIMKVLGIKGGTGLGIGLSSGIRGLSTFAHGGGLTGALKSTTDGLFDGSDAVASGKSALSSDGMKKSRDLAAQIKSGDPNAKHRTLSDKFNDPFMRMRAAKLGITEQTLSRAKDVSKAASKKEENAKYMRDRFNNYGLAGLNNEEKKEIMSTYSITDENDIKAYHFDSYLSTAATQSAKAKEYYSGAEKIGSNFGIRVEESLMDKYNPKYGKYEAKKTIPKKIDEAKNYIDGKPISNLIAEHNINKNREKRIENSDDYKINRGFNPDRYNQNLKDPMDKL